MNALQTRPLLRLTIGIFAISFCCSLGSLSSRAQDNSAQSPASPGNSEPQPPGPNHRQLNPDRMKKRQLDRLERTVQLTSDQESKVTPIIDRFVGNIVSIRNDASLAPGEQKARLRELRKQYAKDLKLILTPDQWHAWKEARKANHTGTGPGENQNESPNQAPQQD